MHRSIPGAVIAAIVVIAAGLAAALWASNSQQPASQLLVQGRVTGIDGKPVSGIKVWLNAWPRSAEAQALSASGRPVPVTVVTSVITSATGRYAIRVSSPAALPEVAEGVIKFSVMTGNSTGWDTASFYRRLVSTAAGARLAVPPGGTTTADLHLKW
jgi:hypothetical protein